VPGKTFLGRVAFPPRDLMLALVAAAFLAGTSLVVAAEPDAQPARAVSGQIPPGHVVKPLKAWGRKGKGDGEFDAPIGIAIDAGDKIYVSEFRNNRVQKFDADGRFLGKFDVEPMPGGIAVDRRRAIYVAPMMSHKVCVYDDAGKLLRNWGKQGSGDGEFDQPGGIAIGPDGSVYVADQVNRRVQRFTSDGRFLGKWGEYGSKPGQFDGVENRKNRTGGPNFLAIDGKGHVFTTEAKLGRVQKFSADGKPILAFGSNSTDPGGFGGRPKNLPGPIAIVIDGSGRLWVSSTNNRVQLFSAEGKYLGGFDSLTAGTELGQFHTPHGMVLDSAGHLYVVDTQNYRIQKFAVLAKPVGGAAAAPEKGARPTGDVSTGNTARKALEQRFAERVQPLVTKYCLGCHGKTKQEGKLDLSAYSSAAAVAGNYRLWTLVLGRLEAQEMPPEDAPARPTKDERQALVAWIKELHEFEATRNEGDPGPVLARRLSNAEYDYTIRDLTGVDIRPTREFPVDPANEAGFDNSGESLAMSPALVKKYLAATRSVADHVVLLPQGFDFAPHPVVTDTDRDKYCVHRIVDFYQQHQVDLAGYFHAAWQFQHRAALGRPGQTLDDLAAQSRLSPKYLAKLVALLTDSEPDAGPTAVLRSMWRGLPAPDAKNQEAVLADCRRLRDLTVRLRSELKPTIDKVQVSGISQGSQPLVLWHNRQRASRRMQYSGDVAADMQKLKQIVQQTAADYAPLLTLDKSDAEAVQRAAKSLARFCQAFPDTFAVVARGGYFDPNTRDQQRLLTAGFHLMQGYFRDDSPLCELILSDADRWQLDRLWDELNFVAAAPQRQYKDFIFFERAEPPRFMFEAEFDFARSEDKDAVSTAKIERLRDAYLAKAVRKGAKDQAAEAIKSYFSDISASIRWVEKTRLAAEESHLTALVAFAQRAYRRPLQGAERDELLGFYRSLRKEQGLTHEDAIRDAIASVLMSPHFGYRFDLAAPGPAAPGHTAQADQAVRPLNDYELASRLSYFLWSSMPDGELLAHAAAGDLHQPDVLKAQTRRMLQGSRVRGLATEFLGNLLDVRRFEEHNSVDRQRFPAFTNELRQAMFEEPIRFFIDMAHNNRPVLELIDGKHTFVNRTLAAHYGMPFPQKRPPESKASPRVKDDIDHWVRIDDATRYGRGGLLPMAVFLTKNSPGLRTSPVKRGYWVVRRLLDERIPPPPPTVPELPKDEADLGKLTLAQTLARHRADKNCATCHQRFDSIGLVFEDYGPIGERRSKDLGGRPVDNRAAFPDNVERQGLDGLRTYLREKRQAEFLANFNGKLFSYALGRTLLPSDQATLKKMQTPAAADGYTLGSPALGDLVEAIVTSRQFLNKRGKAEP
jgi:sugar lactone lactonase YvrE